MIEIKNPSRTRWWYYEDLFLILLIGSIFILPGLGQIALFDRDEPRFASAARNMMVTGDYIVPHFNGELRTDKPPLIYWLMNITYRWFGANEYGARMPSALCGLLTPLVVYFAAGWRFGRITGMLAALMLSATSLFVIESRMATADSTMLLFTTTALACAWRAWEGARHGVVQTGVVPAPKSITQPELPDLDPAPQSAKPTPAPFWVAILFWLSLSVGTLVKGIPLLFVLLPMVVVSMLTGSAGKIIANWRELPIGSQVLHFPQLLWRLLIHGNWRWWKQLKPALGVPALIILVGWWAVAVSVATKGAFLTGMVGNHFLNRAAGPLLRAFGVSAQALGGNSASSDSMNAYSYPPGFYLGLVWVTFWPWCFLLVPAGFHVVRRLRRKTIVSLDPHPYKFLLACIIPMWILLECSRGKLLHYVLPLYVPMVIVCADMLVQSWHRLTDVLAARWFAHIRWLWLAIWLILALVAYLAPGLILSARQAGELANLMWPLIITLLIAGITSTIFWNRPSWPYITVMGYGLALLMASNLVLPNLAALHPSKSAMKEARLWADSGFDLATIGYREPTLVFYSEQQVLPMLDSIYLPRKNDIETESLPRVVRPEVLRVFAPVAKHLHSNQRDVGYQPATSWDEIGRDSTQAAILVVDQNVLNDLDREHIKYYVINRFASFNYERLNQLMRSLGLSHKEHAPPPFSAILIANTDPFKLMATQPATTGPSTRPD